MNICEEIHNTLRQLPRYYFPFDKNKIFKNGIYLLFEKDEEGHNGERIVRVGTHRGDNNLYNRLKEHFLNENKDRSIFRKNIGRALLNKNNDNYLNTWEIDFLEKKNKEKYGYLYNKGKQDGIEKEISKYIQNNFSFVIIEVKDKQERLFYESKLISTISLCHECHSSDNWLGNHSSKDKIKESSLWVVNELYKEPFNLKEWEYFKNNYIKGDNND